jgi:hypothetical protein
VVKAGRETDDAAEGIAERRVPWHRSILFRIRRALRIGQGWRVDGPLLFLILAVLALVVIALLFGGGSAGGY